MTRAEPPRLALFRDGTAVGCFTQNQHETHVVIVEPNGHAFVYMGPHGRASRHLTPTVLSAQRAVVAETIRFRNCYAWCTSNEAMLPYVHVALGDRPTHTRRRRAATLTVAWPMMEVYSSRAMWNDQSNRFEIDSLDGTAHVYLHSSGKVAQVVYLVEIKTEMDHGNEKTYTWIEQSFPVTLSPECFAFPVRLLLRARIARGSGADSFRADANTSEPMVGALPSNGAFDARPTFRPLSTESSLGTDGSAETVSRWIRGMSRSLDRLVVAERNGCVDWVLGHHEVAKTVLILSNANAIDDSHALIECDRGFFHAFDRTGVVAQQFTVETMPLDLTTFGRDFQLMTSILFRAASLYDASCHPGHYHSTHSATTAERDENAATTIVEDLSNDVGRFRAFSDGRVRVVFADRTILQVTPSEFADECEFTFRDGTRGQCTGDSASPAQQPYLRVAMDFSAWVFATPEQRFQRHQLQVEQQLLIERELHKISIRQELNSVATRPVHHQSDIIDQTISAPWPVSGPPSALTPEAVVQLQRETQVHITHVQTLLEDIHGD